MTDTTTAPVTAPQEPVTIEATVEATAKKAWLRIHDDWAWLVARSWSLRFIYIAFLLSAAEAFLPLFVGKTSINPIVFALAIALVTGGAFVARLIAQDHGGVPADGQ